MAEVAGFGAALPYQHLRRWGCVTPQVTTIKYNETHIGTKYWFKFKKKNHNSPLNVFVQRLALKKIKIKIQPLS